MNPFAGAFVAVLLSLTTVSAQEAGVTLATDWAVYKLGSSAGVKITLTNGTNQMVTMSNPAPWAVYQGSQLVAAPYTTQVVGNLQVGQSKSWTWDKKGGDGNLVAAGSYTIKVGPLWSGGSQFTRVRTIALTSTGYVAGSSRFPLAVGNEWTYAWNAGPWNPAGSTTMKVTSKAANSSWYSVTNLVGTARWAYLTTSTKPTLYVSAPSNDLPPQPLFRFNRSVGYTYSTNLEVFTKLKVGATGEFVQTPAGNFAGCYRLDVASGPIGNAGWGKFWFAPGIGLVQYSKWGFGGTQTYRVSRVKVKGSDGKVYTIGLP